MMNNFIEILKSVPEFTQPARMETYVSTLGMSISVITPMDGTAVMYRSTAELQTPQGKIAITFSIDGADSIQSAANMWQEKARTAIEVFRDRLKENEKRIVVPGELKVIN